MQSGLNNGGQGTGAITGAAMVPLQPQQQPGPEGIFISLALLRRIKSGILYTISLVVVGICARYLYLIQFSAAHRRRHQRNPLIALALWCQGMSPADPPTTASATTKQKTISSSSSSTHRQSKSVVAKSAAAIPAATSTAKVAASSSASKKSKKDKRGGGSIDSTPAVLQGMKHFNPTTQAPAVVAQVRPPQQTSVDQSNSSENKSSKKSKKKNQRNSQQHSNSRGGMNTSRDSILSCQSSASSDSNMSSSPSKGSEAADDQAEEDDVACVVGNGGDPNDDSLSTPLRRAATSAFGETRQQPHNRFSCLTAPRTKQHIARVAQTGTTYSQGGRFSNPQSPAPDAFSLPHHEDENNNHNINSRSDTQVSGNVGRESSNSNSTTASSAPHHLNHYTPAVAVADQQISHSNGGGGGGGKPPSFILLLGISGSGKTTWAREYVARVDASFIIVSSDDIRLDLTGSVDDQNRNADVWETVLARCTEALSNGRNVILDATNLQTERRRRFLQQLPTCRRYLKIFPIHKSIAKHRIERDLAARKVRSATPDNIIDLMARQFQESLTAVKDEGWKMK